MERSRFLAIVIGALVVVAVAAYAAFGLLLIGFDVTSYSSDGVAVPDLEFEDVLERAESEGYDVERVGSSGFHPEGIGELDAELGPDYEAFRVTDEYSETRRMWATFDEEEGITVVTFFADDARGAFTEDHLPPDEWMVDRFTVLFDMDEAAASAYVAELKEEVRTTDPSTPGAHAPSVEISESVTFQEAYEDLTARATTVNASSVPGTGWYEREYYADGSKIGGIDFVLSRATVTHEADGRTYRVHVDYHGGVSVDAETRSYRSFEEDEVRSVFRGMFEELGIPPDTIDHLHLEYRGSVW